MAARITGDIGAEVANDASGGNITLEGDTISVTSEGSKGAPGSVTTQSPKNLIPILLVIALIAAIWYYLKKKGQGSTP